jgi:hypothetical protein
MKTKLLIVGTVVGLLLCACDSASPAGPSGSSSGSGTGGGEGGSPATSSAASSGTGGHSCGACPESPDMCKRVECIDDSCVVFPVMAGAPCEAFGHADKCNGGGVCGLLNCGSDADCGPAPKCLSFTCEDDGDLIGNCVAAPVTGGVCDDVCAVAITGPQVAECASYGGTMYHCPRAGGPAIANVVCQQFDLTYPAAWCCDL